MPLEKKMEDVIWNRKKLREPGITRAGMGASQE